MNATPWTTRWKLLAIATFAICTLVLSDPASSPAASGGEPREAVSGFDRQPNGLVDPARYAEVETSFAAVEGTADGVGPVYNASSCGECHANPIIGGSSQVLEMRCGKFLNGEFEEHPGGSLIHSRAIDPAVQERIEDGYDVRTFRASPSILGLGYVEAIADETLIAIAESQARETNGRIAGQVIFVPVKEVPGVTRAGRFGWKDQHASLMSFSGDAYLNEMGITTPLFPLENTSNGHPILDYDPLPDPDEGDNDDLDDFTLFMRATKAPARDAALAASTEAQAGAQTFRQVGCAICHVESIVTAPVGSEINGGAFIVPEALGNRVIHPFSDFLLHDVGTGDGIVDNGFADTRNKIRTAPLWGLRSRNRLMHDGATLTFEEAILRHSGEAAKSAMKFRKLNRQRKSELLAFLRSL